MPSRGKEAVASAGRSQSCSSFAWKKFPLSQRFSLKHCDLLSQFKYHKVPLCSVEEVKVYAFYQAWAALSLKIALVPCAGICGLQFKSPFGNSWHTIWRTITGSWHLKSRSLLFHWVSGNKVIISVPFSRYFMWEMEWKRVSLGNAVWTLIHLFLPLGSIVIQLLHLWTPKSTSFRVGCFLDESII